MFLLRSASRASGHQAPDNNCFASSAAQAATKLQGKPATVSAKLFLRTSCCHCLPPLCGSGLLTEIWSTPAWAQPPHFGRVPPQGPMSSYSVFLVENASRPPCSKRPSPTALPVGWGVSVQSPYCLSTKFRRVGARCLSARARPGTHLRPHACRFATRSSCNA